MTTLSATANILINFLKTIPVGDSVTAAEIEHQTGVPLRKRFSTSALSTARHALFIQDAIAFRVVSGRLVRMSDEDKVAEASRREATVMRQAGNVRQLAHSISDYNSLSVESRNAFDRVVVRSTVISNLSKPSVTNNLLSIIRSHGGAGAVSGQDMIKLLARAV